MQIEIVSKKAKPFKSNDGEEVMYFWYQAIRKSDGVTFQFGSMDGGHENGETLDLNIAKHERADGKIGYKEVAN